MNKKQELKLADILEFHDTVTENYGNPEEEEIPVDAEELKAFMEFCGVSEEDLDDEIEAA